MKAPRAKSPAPAKAPKPAAREVPQLGRVTILELTSRSCRWPTSDSPAFYCGSARADEKRPYCTYHNGLAYPAKGTAAEARVAREHTEAAKRMGGP